MSGVQGVLPGILAALSDACKLRLTEPPEISGVFCCKLESPCKGKLPNKLPILATLCCCDKGL